MEVGSSQVVLRRTDTARSFCLGDPRCGAIVMELDDSLMPGLAGDGTRDVCMPSPT